MPLFDARWNLVLAASLLPACAADSPRAIAVERADSVGIEIVRNLGPDAPITWTFTPIFALGGEDEGVESFYQLNDRSVATDADGNLYVLDNGNHRVLVFDAEGTHLRTMGREGGGPGEFQFFPTGIAVGVDGTVHVYDWGKRGIVRFAADGTPLTTRRIEFHLEGGRWALRGPEVLLETPAGTLSEGLVRLIVLGEAEDTATLATFKRAPYKPVNYGCVQLSGQLPLFSPSLAWTAADSLVFVSATAAYRIDVYRGRRLATSIRRDVSPRPASRELAIREVGEGITISSFGGGGGTCTVPPEKVVDERGVADVLPAIRDIAVAPDGTAWVRHFAVKGEPAPIDVFSPDGAYRGTLPAGSPFPVAFFPDGRIIAIEKDELDVPRVVVYHVET